MKPRAVSLLISILLQGILHAEKPNIIVILIDDMGWADSSTYGSTCYQTPNLTRLAKEGMLFTDAYAASPLCSPTRASIMSGQYPSRLHMTVAITGKSEPEPKALAPEGNAYCGRVQSKDHLPLEVFTLAEALKEAGYSTAHIGKWHLVLYQNGARFHAEYQGFDYVIGGRHLPGPPDYYSPYKKSIHSLSPGPKGEYLNERLAEESIKWIDSVKTTGKPFYLNLYPTVLELAGASLRAGQPMDGQSIVPLMKGEEMEHQPIFTDFPHLFGSLCAPSSCVRVGDWKLIRFHHAGRNAASDAFELFNLKLDPVEAINLATYRPEKVAELDRLIEAHLKDTEALLPVRNLKFQGNPRISRTNADKAPDRPRKLRLAESAIQTAKAGVRRVQLLDQDDNPRKTHALVLEGSEWVKVENRPDGSVEVTWDAPPENSHWPR